MTQPQFSQRPRGFTLVELLMVILVIGILVSILIPTVTAVRKKAQVASTQSEINSIDSAIQQYRLNFTACPGPFPDDMIGLGKQPMIGGNPVNDLASSKALQDVTGTENLVLGIIGGLSQSTTGVWQFDRNAMSNGPRSLNTANPKKYPALIDGLPLTSGTTLLTGRYGGQFEDNAGVANDSQIPEILDKFAAGLPILYLRAHIGAGGVVSIAGKNSAGQPVIGLDTSGNPIPTQYDLNGILGYTQGAAFAGHDSIGEAKSMKPSELKNVVNPNSFRIPHGLQSVNDQRSLSKTPPNTYQYPYDAFPYLVDPNSPPSDTTKPNATGHPRQKDGYILISAGADRVYGTPDDVTNFGSVNP